MQVSAFLAIFKADFGRFWRVSAVFRPVSAVSAASRYDSIWPIRPDLGRISPVQRELKPIRHESSRIGVNRAELARIREKKKKKNADNIRRAGNRVGRRVPHRAASDEGAAPLVPRPFFLDHYHHCYLRRIKERKFKFNCFIQCLWTHFKKSRFLFQHLKIGEEFSSSRGE